MKELCGAATRSGGTCQKPAGWGTQHVGEGKCKLHGGATPVKHGLNSRYAAVRRPRIRELIESFQTDSDPENLLPEVQLLRALILDYIERYDENTEALLAWHASFNPMFDRSFTEWLGAYRKWQEGYEGWKAQWLSYRENVERTQHYYRGGWPEPPGIEVYSEPPPPPEPLQFQTKPREVADILKVGNFIINIGGLVERIQKARQEGSISLATLDRIIEEYGAEATNAVREIIEDGDLRSEILNAIERRWNRIIIPANSR